MKTFADFVALFTASALVGFGAIYLAGQSGCGGRQLTVEEADSALAASCVILAQAMTHEHPEQLDRVVAQACRPGRTRSLIARVLVQGTNSSTTEYLDFLLDDGSGTSKPPAPATNLPSSEADDAGVHP